MLLFPGRYLYLEATDRQPGDSVSLTSPAFNSSGNGTCVEFWYHMYGVDVGGLYLYTEEGSQQNSQPVWSVVYGPTGTYIIYVTMIYTHNPAYIITQKGKRKGILHLSVNEPWEYQVF